MASPPRPASIMASISLKVAAGGRRNDHPAQFALGAQPMGYGLPELNGPKVVSTPFAIPRYCKIDLRIFGDKEFEGNRDVQRTPVAKCIEGPRVARWIKPYCLRPHCSGCGRVFVGVGGKSRAEGANE